VLKSDAVIILRRLQFIRIVLLFNSLKKLLFIVFLTRILMI